MSSLEKPIYTTKRDSFIREYKRVEPYKNRRQLTNEDLRNEYRENLIEKYNELTSYLAECHESSTLQFKTDIYKKQLAILDKLKESFNILGISYEFSADVFSQINIEYCTEIDDVMSESDDQTVGNNSNIVNSENEITKANKMTQTTKEFISMANHMMGSKFSGDPLALESFVDSIELLRELCEKQNERVFLKFVLTRLDGKAREAVPENVESVDEIMKCLKEKIKTESSKIIEGRILALRAEKNNLTKFAERAEELAEQLRRSLCVEGFSKAKAKEMAVEKTVDMCRRSARNETIKAVLASSRFDEPKEVIAKMIVEISNVRQDRVSQPNRNNRNGNSNGYNNSNRNQNNNGQRGSRQNNQNSGKNTNQYNNGQSGSYHNRSNGKKNYHDKNQNQNYQYQNGYSNGSGGNAKSIRMVSGNEQAPQVERLD